MLLHGLILAGGEGRRLGGIDKALLTFGGQTLLQRTFSRFYPQVHAIALSANGDPARFPAFAGPVLRDAGAAGLGPMAGVLAGLDWLADAGGDCLATVSVDTPFFPGDLVAQLVLAGESTGGFALAECGGRLHPTCGLWPISQREPLRAALQAGERRIGDWAQAQGAARAVFPETAPDSFLNINTPEDLAMAEVALKYEGSR